jgi:hypothetical protein
MRKISLTLLFAICALFSWGQTEECFSAEFSTPNLGEWTVVYADTWIELANFNTNGNNTFCLPQGCFYLYGYLNPLSVAQGINVLTTGLSMPVEIQYSDSSGYTIGFFSFNSIS